MEAAIVVVDTNVVSELVRPVPDPNVMKWFDDQDAYTLYLSAVVEAELRRGTALLPFGQRRNRLIAEIDTMIEDEFEGKVLPFERSAACEFAYIYADRSASGRQISFSDCLIAATARAHEAAVATRDVNDFEGCGIEVINPWKFKGAIRWI